MPRPLWKTQKHLRNHALRSLVHLSPRDPMEAIISNFSDRIFVASGNLYCCHEMNGHREKYVSFKPLLKTEKHNVIVEQNKINFGGGGPGSVHTPLSFGLASTPKQTNKHPNKQTNAAVLEGDFLLYIFSLTMGNSKFGSSAK